MPAIVSDSHSVLLSIAGSAYCRNQFSEISIVS
jgi:hypothetical protein